MVSSVSLTKNAKVRPEMLSGSEINFEYYGTVIAFKRVMYASIHTTSTGDSSIAHRGLEPSQVQNMTAFHSRVGC